MQVNGLLDKMGRQINSSVSNSHSHQSADAMDLSKRIHEIFTKLGPSILQAEVLPRLLATKPNDLNGIISILQENPVLAARTLSVANSAAIGVASEISTVKRAAIMLGARHTRSLAIAHSLRLIMRKAMLPDEMVSRLWTNALRKAYAARSFCELIDPSQAELAYTIALLSDMGLPMLMAVDPEFYRTILQSDPSNTRSVIEAECEHFGIDHGIVGHSLLTHWGVSNELCDGIVQHHLPPSDEELAAQNDWSILRLAVFFASLLPHLNESISSGAEHWIRAIHARFLLPHYKTFNLFLHAIDAKVKETIGSAQPVPTMDYQRLVAQVANELAGDNIELVANVSRIECVLNQEQKGLHELRSKAFTDSLTKLLNRRGFMTLVENRLQVAHTKGLGVCCVMIDLDDFKTINDTHGHHAGDQTLRGVNKLLRAAVPSSAVLARLGGDEFAVFIADINDQGARDVAQNLARKLEGHRMRLSPTIETTLHASIGVVFSQQGIVNRTHDELLRMADDAMYERKKNGKHGAFYLNTSDPNRLVILERNPRTATRTTPRPTIKTKAG